MSKASRICEWLYIGNAEFAADASALERHGVTHVLNCCQRLPFASEATCNQHLRLRDDPDEKLAPHLHVALDFLDKAQAQGGICLVHCRGGKSRSVAIVLAYLVLRGQMRLDAAWALVQARHEPARPNRGFAAELLDLDLVTHGSSSANVFRDTLRHRRHKHLS